jgi:hypothetical protein
MPAGASPRVSVSPLAGSVAHTHQRDSAVLSVPVDVALNVGDRAQRAARLPGRCAADQARCVGVVLAITSEVGLPQYCPAYTFSPRGTLSRFIGQYPASRILAAASIPVCGLT